MRELLSQHAFRYEHTDMPPGMTIDQWKARRARYRARHSSLRSWRSNWWRRLRRYPPA